MEKKCPICGEKLWQKDVKGVTVDYCPNDCGVWLDRGELDEIIGNITEDAESDLGDWVLGFGTGLSTAMLLGD